MPDRRNKMTVIKKFELVRNLPHQFALPSYETMEAGVTSYRLKGIQGRVISKIGENIVRNVYPPGTLLPRETDLMDMYQASRTTIREAIKVLCAKGLVETRQKVGTRVLGQSYWNIFDSDVLLWHAHDNFDNDILTDLIEMRQLVEPAAARYAATRATLDEIAIIGENCEAMRLAMGDMAAYAKADVEFHLSVFHASHNVMLSRFGHIIAEFLRISFRIQQSALNSDENRIEDDYANHVKIYDAINRSDPATAEARMMDVVLHGKASLQRARLQTK
jgi:GntR family transcriptional regulator, galactonate operon transcriptional repressor